METTHQQVKFDDRTGLLSLAKFCEEGGVLSPGLPVLCERNYRTPLQPGTLKSWHIGSVKMDLTGYGKYSESTVEVEINNRLERWPFSMILIRI